MSSFCGILNVSKQAVPLTLMDRFLDFLQNDNHPYRSSQLLEHVGFGQLNRSTGIEPMPIYDSESELLLTGDIRLDHKGELTYKLGLKNQVISDEHLVLNAFRKWGVRCPEHLHGEFAFVIYNKTENTLFCVRDHFGFKPFYYSFTGEQFVLSTSLHSFKVFPGLTTFLNESWLMEYFSGMIPPMDSTLFASIHQLAPGHSLLLDGYKLIIKRYWNPDPYTEVTFKNESDYVEAFKEKLFLAIGEKARSEFPVGCELSGGIDSSTIASISNRILGEQGKGLTALSQVMSPENRKIFPPYKDEQKEQDNLCTYAGIKNHIKIDADSQGIFQDMTHSVYTLGSPVSDSYSYSSEILLRVAEENGIRTLLSGFGGDQLVSADAGGLVQELLDNRKYQLAWNEVVESSRIRNKSVPKKLIKVFLRDILKLPVQKVFGSPLNEVLNKNIHNRIRQFNLENTYIDKLVSESNYSSFSRPWLSGTMREREASRILYDDIPNRITEGSVLASRHNIEYRYPLLDIPLVEFYLSLPAIQKQQNGITRRMIRNATKDLIPEMIRMQLTKQGNTIPNYYQRIFLDKEKFEQYFKKPSNAPYLLHSKMKRVFEKMDPDMKNVELFEVNDALRGFQFRLFYSELESLI